MKCTIWLDGDITDAVKQCESQKSIYTARKVSSLSTKWSQWTKTFDWLSRMRTALGAGFTDEKDSDEIGRAIRSIADDAGMTHESMGREVRETLLVLWKDWSGRHSPLTRQQDGLLELLRQEIEYAVMVIEYLREKPIDFLDAEWYDPRGPNDWASLIEALPREEALARRDFPQHALMYLPRFTKATPQIATLDAEKLQSVLSANWERSRPLRRFALAFHRLHEELRGEQLMASEAVIRKAECIEQFLLTVLHSERVLSLEYRERTKVTRYGEVGAIVRFSLNQIFSRWGLMGRKIAANAQTSAKKLVEARASLHALDESIGLPLVSPDEVASGNANADEIASCFVNLVIARNYAAHHDVLDYDLVYPSDGDPAKHPGGIILSSVLTAVVAVLMTR